MAGIGPANAFAADPVAPPTPERRQRQPLEELGFYLAAGSPHSRAAEKAAADREFMEAAGHRGNLVYSGNLGEAAFVEYAQRLWGFKPKLARAAFWACDVDGSGAINKDEHLLLKAALVSFRPERDNASPTLVQLRCRTIYALYAASRDDGLAAVERHALVADLCAGPSHVASVLASMRWPTDDAQGRMSYQQLLGAVEAGDAEMPELTFASMDLHTRDLLLIAKPASLRVVLDPRCMQTEQPVGGAAPGGALSPSRCASAVATGHMANQELVLSPSLRAPAGSDWRGASFERGSQAHAVATDVVGAARLMAFDALREPDVADSAWRVGGPSSEFALAAMLRTSDVTAQAVAMRTLAEAAQTVLTAQPMVVRVPAPAKIFGDVHGQLRDLLLLLALYGFPDHHGGDVETVAYVFNGDWVDRGAHQLEVVALLFALKVLYPARVFLVRGNHEFRSQSVGMGQAGFAAHVAQRFGALCDRGQALYEAVHTAFEWLPLAAKVADAVLVLHGGIGDGSWGIDDDLARVQRPLRDVEQAGAAVPHCACQALWSDPTDSDADMSRGVHPSTRGGNMGQMVTFGPDVTESFCKREGVQLVVRSHQYVREGIKFMHGGRLATLFSARNYLPPTENDGALLLIAPDEQGNLRVRAKRLQQRLP
tara:strand:- start:633 stop:2594 length:1962 start_codon:yes stop_codon:yes gene_type:complete